MMPKTNPNERLLTRHRYLKRQRDPLVCEAILLYINGLDVSLEIQLKNISWKNFRERKTILQ